MESISDFNIKGLPKIIFGEGKFSSLPAIISSYGSNALIFIGGKSLKKAGRLNEFVRQLHQAQIKYKGVSVWNEPATEVIDSIVSQIRKTPVDVVVAIGGGSVIDFGKAVSAMLAADGSVKDYLEGVGTKKPNGAKIPFIAVPTTAGTGCEATKNAVICDRKEGYKKSLRHDAYMPDVALVDPALTLTLPTYITTASGLDAVSQLVEAYTSTKADVSLDSLVLKALSYASESLLPLALGKSNDISLREKMSYAALVSGIALNRSGLGAVHGIAGPLGGLFPVPHGIACGKLLFPVMTFVIKKIGDEKNIAAQKRFADIGRIFTGEAGGDDIFYCKQFLSTLDKWTRTLKLPQLSRFGMTALHMEKTIAISDSKNSPALLSKENIKVILEVIR
ncbi:alcohol dehydrogenase [hydrocarbon metagenome]|uniref:Alcohol dehydrogenase n=1 Tax=hydrocarbon metagenome TaxID=938273 RepID=A0A0W8FMY2_9ZZZZ